MADPRLRRQRLFAYCLCCAMAVAVSPGACAQEGDAELAAGLYRRAAELYRQKRFAEAAVLLREAYRHRPDPVLQYNLARACEEMDDLPCAVEAYRRYLASADPADRAAVERRLAACRARLSLQAEESRAPAAGPAPARAPAWPGLGPRIAAGTAGAALGLGGGLAWWARSRQQQAAREPVQRLAAEKQRSAESAMRSANVALAVGGAAAAVAAVWWVLDARAARGGERAEADRAGPALAAVGPGLGLSIRF